MINWLARRLWGAMLWVIRRPLSRRLQRAALLLVPEHRRERARQSMIAQERFARRIGLPLIRLVLWMLFLSILLTLSLNYVFDEVANGRLIIPTKEALEESRQQSR